jgi:hypothetical protein
MWCLGSALVPLLGLGKARRCRAGTGADVYRQEHACFHRRSQPSLRRGGSVHNAGLDGVESLRRRICTDPGSGSGCRISEATHADDLRTNPNPLLCFLRLLWFSGLGSGLDLRGYHLAETCT